MAVDVECDRRSAVAEMLRDDLDRGPGEEEVGREGVPEGVNVPVVDPGVLEEGWETSAAADDIALAR